MGTAIIIGILAIIVVIAVISSVKHMKGEGGCGVGRVAVVEILLRKIRRHLIIL